MREVLYSPAPQATWHHYLHGDLSDDEAGWICRPERRPLLITGEHLRQLAQVIASGDASASPERPVLAIANLSLGDPDLQAGQGAIALLAHVRIPVTEGEPLRFCHALVAAKRDFTPQVLLEALHALAEVMGLDQAAGERESENVYLGFLGAESEADARSQVLGWLGALDRRLPAAALHEPSSEWILQSEDQYLPWRIVVRGAQSQVGELREVMAGLGAVMFSSALRWSLVTDSPEPHDEREGAVYQVLEGDLRAIAERTVSLAELGEGLLGSWAGELDRWVSRLLPLRRARIETYSSFYRRGGASGDAEIVDLSTPTAPPPTRSPVVKSVELPETPLAPPLPSPAPPRTAPAPGSAPPAGRPGAGPARDALLEADLPAAPPPPGLGRADAAAGARGRRSQVFVPPPPGRGERVRRGAFDDAFPTDETETYTGARPAQLAGLGAAEASAAPEPATEELDALPLRPPLPPARPSMQDFLDEGLSAPSALDFPGRAPALASPEPAEDEPPSVSHPLPTPPAAAGAAPLDPLDPLGIFDPELRRKRPRKPPPPTQPWSGEQLDGPALLDAPLGSRSQVELDPPDRATVIGVQPDQEPAAEEYPPPELPAPAVGQGWPPVDAGWAPPAPPEPPPTSTRPRRPSDPAAAPAPPPAARPPLAEPPRAAPPRAEPPPAGAATPAPLDSRAFAAPPLIPGAEAPQRPTSRRRVPPAADPEARRTPAEPAAPPPDPAARRAKARPVHVAARGAAAPEELPADAIQLEAVPDPMIALRRKRRSTLRRYWPIAVGAAFLLLALTALVLTGSPDPGPRGGTPPEPPEPPMEPVVEAVEAPPAEVPPEPLPAEALPAEGLPEGPTPEVLGAQPVPVAPEAAQAPAGDSSSKKPSKAGSQRPRPVSSGGGGQTPPPSATGGTPPPSATGGTPPPSATGAGGAPPSSGGGLQSLEPTPQPAQVSWVPYGVNIAQLDSVLLVRGPSRVDLMKTQSVTTGSFSLTVVFKGSGTALSAGQVRIEGDSKISVQCSGADGDGLPTQCSARVTPR